MNQKQKLIRILMLAIIASGVGMFVSCKDTNGDLANELREQGVTINLTLQEALDKQKQILEAQIQALNQTIEQMKGALGATTDNDLSAKLQDIMKQLDELKNINTSSPSGKTDLQKALEEFIKNNQFPAPVSGGGSAGTFTIIELYQTTVSNEAAIKLLQETVGNLQEQLNKIKNCECNFEDKWEILSDLATRMPLTEKMAEEAMALATTNQTNIGDLTVNFNTLKQNFTELNDLVTNILTPQIESAVTNASDALAKATANEEFINSIKDKLPIAFTDLEDLKEKVKELETKCEQVGINTEDITTLKTRVTTLENDMDSYKAKVDKLEGDIAGIKADCAANLIAAKEYADQEIEAAKIAILASVKNDIDALDIKIDGKADQSDIDDINKQIEDIKTKLCACTPVDLTEINNRLNSAEGDIKDIKENLLKTINDNIEQVAKDLETTNGNLTTLTGRVDDIDDLIAIINDSIDSHFQELVDLKALTALLNSTTVKIEDYNMDKAEILQSISANTTSIGTLQTAVSNIENDVQSIKDDVADLNTRITEAESKINEMQEDIAEIRSDISALQEALAKQVTNIIIQSTHNPMFGSFSMPFDVQSNVLMAFYGVPANDIEFPTYRTGNYINPEEALTAKDIEMLSGINKFNWYANVPLMLKGTDEYMGYAGKVYMTINPNTANLDGLKLDIVNSLDEVSPIVLTPIQKSDMKLEFGYSRANNGFYETNAEISISDIENAQSLNINTSAIQSAITEIAQNRTGASLSKIASDMYDVVKSMRMDRNGLKCSYTENDNEHSVYSEYNMAAVAYKPLSLGTLKDLHVETIPGINRANALLDRVAKTLKDNVHVAAGSITGSTLSQMIGDLKIKDIEIKDLTEDQLALFKVDIDTTIYIGGLQYHLQFSETKDVPVKFEKDLTIPVEIQNAKVKVPVKIDEDIEVDLTDVKGTYSAPTIVVTTELTGNDVDEELGAVLIVPIKDADGNPALDQNGNAMYAKIPMNQININATATGEGGTVTLDGKAIAHLKYEKDIDADVNINQDINYHLVMEETVPVTIDIDKWVKFGDYNFLRDAAGNIIYDKDGKTPLLEYVGEGNGEARGINIWITRDLSDAAEELWGTVKDQLGNVNGMLADVRKIVEEVNRLLSKVNDYEDRIDNNIDNYVDKIKDYIEKLNNKLTSLINSANSRLQPVLIASNGSGIKRLSGSKSYPTVLKKDVTFYPTSWTMELLTPFARKHVAVTNVFNGTSSAQEGNSDCVARLKAANTGNMNQVINGDMRKVEAFGFTPGYTYEVAYSALDFHGNMATRKYYITVTE